MRIDFKVQGKDRKKMAGIIAEAILEEITYTGVPKHAYCIGAFTVTREGFLEFDSATIDENQVKAVIESLQAAGFNYEGSDCIAIGYPAEGFTDEVFANLEKLVASKAPLIKKALCIEDLTIERGETELTFDWFHTGLTREETYVFAQFITQLCKTAKGKKRIVAKAPESFENEKFAMRVWLIGLGMVGKEYALARKLLLKNLEGNGAWRYGKPEKAAPVEDAQETDSAPEAAEPEVLEEAPAEEDTDA